MTAKGFVALGLWCWLSLPAAGSSDRPRAPAPPSTSAASLPRAVASYRIHAALDAELHRIAGRASIELLNTSEKPLDHVFLHLYLNAFESEHTLFMRKGRAPRSGRSLRRAGYIQIERLSLAESGGENLWERAARHTPDDPDDRTDIRVPLPEPVAPGERLTLFARFSSQLPELVERSGYAGDFHMIGQWFPKLAKLENDGSFAHFAYHPLGEFYADFGDYDVTLRVPAAMRVGASGRRVSESIVGADKEVRYVARGVHDFAWSAWSEFVERRERIGGVEVVLLYPDGLEAATATTLEALRLGLPYFSRLYGPYPYPTLTVVHPPVAAAPAGGMEYPTLITTGGGRYQAYLGARTLEAVTMHELAHQWFYGLLASNEPRFPFLDEGLATFADTEAQTRWFGDHSAYGGPGPTLSLWAIHRAWAAEAGAAGPIAAPVSSFSGLNAVSQLAYSRTAVVLETFGRIYGQERILSALGRYAKSERFSHPTPSDLLEAFRAELGDGPARELERALFERGSVDYEVSQVASAPAPQTGRGEARAYVGHAVVRRRGPLRLPVRVDLVAEDGTRQSFDWDGKSDRRRFDYRGESPLRHALVDPETRLLIDVNLANNGASLRPASTPRLSERMLYAAALLLSWLGP
ncbi:MAG TPA: M1 family metallopeptidase [Polyangiaceae bacterium]